MAKRKRVLLPIDGSEASDITVKKGIAESKKSKAEIIFLHVINMPILPNVGPSIKSTVKNEMEKRARKYINSVEQKAEKEYLKYQSLIRKGNPAEKIVEIANKKDVDLIIMAKHRRGNLDRFLLGSVTEKVLRNAQCDVMVVQPDVLGKKNRTKS